MDEWDEQDIAEGGAELEAVNDVGMAEPVGGEEAADEEVEILDLVSRSFEGEWEIPGILDIPCAVGGPQAVHWHCISLTGSRMTLQCSQRYLCLGLQVALAAWLGSSFQGSRTGHAPTTLKGDAHHAMLACTCPGVVACRSGRTTVCV